MLQRLTAGEHTTRTHTLAEFYGILTGRGIRWERDGQAYELKLAGEQAAQWLKDNLTPFRFIDLTAQEVFVLPKLQARCGTARLRVRQ